MPVKHKQQGRIPQSSKDAYLAGIKYLAVTASEADVTPMIWINYVLEGLA